MKTDLPFQSPSGLPVFKYLDVSMAHITVSDCNLLELDAVYSTLRDSLNELTDSSFSDKAIVYKKEGGFFVHVSSDCASEYEERFKNAGYSEAFLLIFHDALAVDAHWICFDVDGSVSESLPLLIHKEKQASAETII